jgi:pimeloyl-ACP methyl ester carboxylesterase
LVTFCLIHGNWHDGSCWEPLVERLEARGHAVVAPGLPFDDPHASYEQRAEPAMDALEDREDPVVVVGHSVGSAEAALVATKRPAALLVHLCPRLGPFAPPSGAPDAFRKDFPFPASRPDGTSVWESDAAIDAMYPRLAPETARSLAERLRPGAPAAGDYPLPAHPDIPTELIYSTEDEFFEPAWERFMARELLGVEPIEIPGGHFPMAEDPDRLAGLLDRLVQEHGLR